MPTRPYKGVGYGVVAYQIMQEIYERCSKEGMSPDEIAAEIDGAYPWENRGKSHRYRRWLDARREFFEQHGLPGLRPRQKLKQAAQQLNKDE